jgi:hypothetical protein
VAIALVSMGAIMVTAGTASSTPEVFSYPVLRFDDAAQQIQLKIPTPACPVGQSDCEWMLYVNQPGEPGQPVVAQVIGTSGVLTVAYPDFCGVLQADALIGPAPWVYKTGIRRRIDTCVSPTTTTTSSSTTTTTSSTTTTTTTDPSTTTTTSTEPSTTTTTTDPSTTTTTTSTSTTLPATTTTQSSVPPVVSAGSTTPTTGGGGSSQLPFTDATSASSSGAGTTATSSLAFTGLDIKPLVLIGSMMILIGGLLLTTMETKRRALRRVPVIKLDQVREGTRRTSSWFLGE